MGYTSDGEQQHWNIAQETIKKIPTTNLCVCCADANGQLGNRDRTDHGPRKIIGVNTIEREKETGGGKQLQDICVKHDLIPMTTWRRQPKQTKHEPEDISTRVRPFGKPKEE